MVEISSALIGATVLFTAATFVYLMFITESKNQPGYELIIVIVIVLILSLTANIITQIELRDATIKNTTFLEELKIQDTKFGNLKKKCKKAGVAL